MPKIIGYMVTWTTYGSWLPGDERGYVENGHILPANRGIFKASKKQLKSQAVSLTKQEMKIIHQVILNEAQRIHNEILALVVCTNHVHIAIHPHSQSIDKIISRYKSITTRALWDTGRKGRIWTKGFDKRFCFSEEELAARIKYINKHKYH